MAKGDVLGHVKCGACGDSVALKETKTGQGSYHCACGFQGFARSPKATAALKAQSTPRGDPPKKTDPPAPKKDGEGDSFADWLKG
jgi:hypothetical protein